MVAKKHEDHPLLHAASAAIGAISAIVALLVAADRVFEWIAKRNAASGTPASEYELPDPADI